MEQFQPVLLNVWREACRHIEIGESTATIGAMLTRDLPLEQILIRQIVPGEELIETLAVGFATDEEHLFERTPCSRATLDQLQDRLPNGSVVHLKAEAVSEPALAALVGSPRQEVLCTRLGDSDGRYGVLILLAKAGQRFNTRHAALTEALIAPLSSAYQNDKRLQEMARLQKTAEADNRSLLRRLGRERLGDTIIGSNSGLKSIMERVDLVAQSNAPVLIFGETGAGKELIARAIHERSDRQGRTFLRVNCGAIPPDLVDSELFGHEKGAFTGASGTRPGWFERADGGTLFLDEIAELSLSAQVRLLRVLQDGWLERVGGHKALHVDVRIVAATHRDLPAMVSNGRFREDLWYRVAVFPLVLPPLRERKEDIGALANHFARRAAKRFGLRPVQPSAEGIARLRSYDWPGNVRELAAVIDRAAILGNGQRLDIDTALGPSGHPFAHPVPAMTETVSKTDGKDAPLAPLSEATRRHIEKALTITRGRIEGPYGAARILAINPHTLRAKMRRLGIDWTRFRDAE